MIWPTSNPFSIIINNIYNFPHFTDPCFTDEETEAQIVHSSIQHIVIYDLFIINSVYSC